MDFKTESAVAKKVFSSDDFLAFETDIAKNLLAADAGDGIGLYRLTDRQPLWQGQPSSKYFTIEHQPEGFGFSSETEYHSVNAGSHSLYFTSFLGFKPVEIYNDYLYKGLTLLQVQKWSLQ
ncbi:MAG: hypothetical protein EON98_03005 [Chitinophagaceae bacterium]|nr:MAG: hypothetical protein EON98_03005 [Chitinophagaceae bacterium]